MRGWIARASLLIFWLPALAAQQAELGPGSDEIPGLEADLGQEAPPALLSSKGVLDSAVLSVKGSWSAGLSSTPVFTFSRSGAGAGFSGSPLSFTQLPQLEILLRFLDVWTFQAVIGDETSEDLFSFGYRPEHPGLLRSAVLGNGGLAIPRLDSLSLGKNSASAFGISGSWGDDPATPEGKRRYGFSADALLRYERASLKTMEFVGHERIRSSAIAASAFLRGRFFALPDRGISGLRLFVGDPSGAFADDEGFRYSELDLSADAASLSEGRIALKSSLAGRCLALYSRADGGGPSGAGRTLNGMSALLIYDPDMLVTDFEDLSRYHLPDGLDADASFSGTVSSSGDGLDPASFSIRYESSTGTLRVLRSGQTAGALALRPFSDAAAWIYGVGARSESDCPIRLNVSSASEVSAYTLEGAVVPSSISVQREGRSETAFRFDGATNEISFDREPGPGERIEISYSVSDGGSSANGAAAGGLSVDASLARGLSFHGGAAFRWATASGGPSVPGSELPGTVAAEASLGWKGGETEAMLSANAAYSVADSSGRMRLLAMEDFGSGLGWDEASWLPSLSPLLPGGLALAARKLPLYRDYLKVGPFGSTLMPVDWPSAPDVEDPAAKAGPYPVQDDVYGKDSVIEFALSAGEWTGAQTRLPASFSSLAGGAIALVIPVKYLASSGSAPLCTFQVGRVGAGEGESDAPAEDTRVIASVSAVPGNAWSEVELPLGSASLLASGAALRILAQATGATAGKILLGTAYLRGAPFRTSCEDVGASVTVEERGSLTGSDGPDAAFPDDYSALRPSGGVNGYLRLSIASNPSGGGVSLSRTMVDFAPSEYRRLSFFIRASAVEGTASRLSLQLSGPGGASLSWAFPLTSLPSGWQRMDILLDSGAARLVSPDGTEASLDAASFTPGTMDTVRFSVAGASSGTIDIDELHLSDAAGEFSSQLSAALSWKGKGALLKAGNLDLLSQPLFAFEGGLHLSESPSWTANVRAGVDLLLARLLLAGRLSGDFGSLPELALSHEVTLPIGDLVLHERFSRDPESGWSALDTLALGSGDTAASFESNAVATGGTWTSGESLRLGLPLGFESLGAQLNASRTTASTGMTEGSYPGDWLESFRYRAEGGGTSDTARSLGAKLSAQRKEARNADLSASMGTIYAGPDDPLCGGSLSLGLSPGIPLGPEKIIILRPSYSKSASYALPRSVGGWTDDLAAWGEAQAAVSPFWTSIPFLELLGDGGADALSALESDPDSFSLSSSAGISLERSPGLGWVDLILPSLVSYTHTLLAKREGSTVSRAVSDAIDLDLGATDVFGRLGSSPCTGLFDSDEYLLTNRASWTRGPGGESDLELSATASLLWKRDDGSYVQLKDDYSRGSSSWQQSFDAVWILEDWAPGALDGLRGSFASLLEKRRISGKGPFLPFLETALSSGRLRATRGLEASFQVTGSDSLSFILPFTAKVGLKLGKALDSSAAFKLQASWTSPGSSLSFASTFSLQAKLSF